MPAQRRASDGGYSSVNEYVADIVAHDLTGWFNSDFNYDGVLDVSATP